MWREETRGTEMGITQGRWNYECHTAGPSRAVIELHKSLIGRRLCSLTFAGQAGFPSPVSGKPRSVPAHHRLVKDDGQFSLGA